MRYLQIDQAPLPTAERTTGVLRAFCAVMIFVLVGLFVMTIQRYSELKDSIGEDKMWAVMQLDREARKLTTQLNVVVTTEVPSAKLIDDLRVRYDILYSRSQILTDGPFAEYFKRDKRSGPIVFEVDGLIKSWEGIFDRVGSDLPLPKDELEEVGDALPSLVDQCEVLVSNSALTAADNVSDQRAVLLRIQVVSAVVSVILIGCVFLMNILQRRHLDSVLKAKEEVDDLAATLQDKVVDAVAKIREREEEIIETLSVAAGYKDSETELHTRRVALYSEAIAKSYGLDEEATHDIKLASLMHDIGKVSIPDAILQKKGPFTPKERAVMNTHTISGGNILEGSKAPLLRLASDIAMSHHERWDGEGYPNGLKGEAIPLAGRIVALADNFDALTSTRPYKVSWTAAEAIDHIVKSSGSHFDPKCVEAFEAALPTLLDVYFRHQDEIVSPEAVSDR